MKRLLWTLILSALLALAYPAKVWAYCYVSTYIVNGVYVTCQTCCVGNHCTTHCF